MNHEDLIYQRIGEFVVSFQWVENKLREIGWFILDPKRSEWPPLSLCNLTNERLIDRVHQLFLIALPKCNLSDDLEEEFRELFASAAKDMHRLRRDRNRILHSAFIELKAGGEVQGLLLSNPKIQFDDETGETLYDQELLTDELLSGKIKMIADLGLFLNQAHLQLIHSYPRVSA